MSFSILFVLELYKIRYFFCLFYLAINCIFFKESATAQTSFDFQSP